jgi:hypothetical protein
MIEKTNAGYTFEMVFMLFYLDFWQEIIISPGSRNDIPERIFVFLFAIVALAFFPISLPIIFITFNVQDIIDEKIMNIYGLIKKEILKEQAKIWFMHKIPEYDSVRNVITIGLLYITSPIMFPVIYLFFISVQKYFAKKAIISALRA